MDTAPYPTPDAEIAALRSLLAERDAALAERDALLLNSRLEIDKLKVQLARARREQYGQSSERLTAEVGQLEMLIGDHADGQRRGGRARLHELSRPAPGEAALDG